MKRRSRELIDEKTILFVTCVNDHNLYKQSIENIKGLHVPDGYSVDFFPIYNARSMAAGYNLALQSSAKYKVYLHQDVIILNSIFIHDVLQLFQKNNNLGLLGLVGSKQLLKNGSWWEEDELFGKVIMNNRTRVFGEVLEPFESVQVVDGFLMVTQYDVPWREELFQGFHFYDVSQSLEFIRKGYEVGIPKQIKPWCNHLDSDVHVAIRSDEYKKYKEVFFRNYLLDTSEKSFLFVTCVSNEKLYDSCVQSIGDISIPSGYSIELLPIRNVKSMTQGYNVALKYKAKYKIYLHQDTCILNKNILHELLQLFNDNSKLGLLGLVGCKNLPSDGTWWNGKELLGKMIGYHNNEYVTFRFNDVESSFESVESIDGFFMATQYDIPWNEKIEGFHFYDASQALNFIHQGYVVGIPRQNEPWASHINKEKTIIYDRSKYNQCKLIFRSHYSESLNS